MPTEGYTAMIASILDAPNVELRLGESFEALAGSFAHVFYSGPIDRYFNYKLASD
jgi:UDP-galactopyranose mutase